MPRYVSQMLITVYATQAAGVAFDLYFEDEVKNLFNALERVVDAIRNSANSSMLNCIVWSLVSDGDTCNSAMLYNNEGPIGAIYYSSESWEAEFIPMNVLTAASLSISIVQHLFIGTLQA
ncbi:hypothetical protein ARMGADRAFT_1084385 [Armillaria gallica]|uniref:Uncharacterized protein n=1 Tax=Armillaria gallica TaxID=47427 RepID=A0A2H3D0M4_ARMGA|nr:hypothetical protein ARMGADRAFT_1084385 [Armillaria gallica]